MVAKVKLAALDGTRPSFNNDPVARIGDVIQVLVQVTDRAKSRGGSFRITHPAIAGGGVTCRFEGRYDTGDSKKALRRRKVAPDHYRGADQFTYSFTVANQSVLAEVSLVAVTECEVTPPDQPKRLRAAVDQRALDLEYPVRLSVVNRARFAVSRTGLTGVAANTQNALGQQLKVFLRLYFLDPEGVERTLPDGFPVRMRIGDQQGMRVDTTVSGAGHVSIGAIGPGEVLLHRALKVELGDNSDNVILCELPGQTASQEWGDVPAPSDLTGTLPKRFFSFPRWLSLAEISCEVTNDDGRWDAVQGALALAKDNRPASLGTFGAPVKIVLKPVWQFAKFTYFDRHFGHSDHGDQDVVMAPVTLKGYRARPATPTELPEVRSNWWVDPSNDKKFVQCLPWFRQHLQDHTAAAKPDASTEVRFSLPEKTCMKSVSATDRRRVIATEEELKPGAERLKFYDLPTLWQAQNYYGWLSDTDGEHGFYEDIAGVPTTLNKPVVFNLDDMVLTDADGRALTAWTHADRYAIFAHTFDDTLADCSDHGLYKADAADNKSWFTQKPAAGAPEENDNYVRAKLRWARLIAARGNLHDVFDRRSVASSPALDTDVIGARAAVRWIDATTAPHGAAANSVFDPRSGLQQPADAKHFAIHPFMQQEFVTRTSPLAAGTVIDEWGAPLPAGGDRFVNGRFDAALLRCCGVDAAKEVAAIIRYHRYCFDYTARANLIDADVGKQATWPEKFLNALLKRWNGTDGVNTARATLKAQLGSQGPDVKLVTIPQVLPLGQAHHRVKLVAENETSSMDAENGKGYLRVKAGKPITPRGFAGAHENGHNGGLPDDYYPDTFDVPDGRSNHMPGSPYALDSDAMMFSNQKVRARYFWPMAEWLRGINGFANVKYAIHHGASRYQLPYCPTVNSKRSLYQWPIRGRLQSTLAGTALCDPYLYLLGDDEYSRTVLPGLIPGARVDAILVVMVVASVQTNAALTDAHWEELLPLCQQRVQGALNNKVTATFSVTAGVDPPAVQRCLLHVVPHLDVGPIVAATHLGMGLVFGAPSVAFNSGASPKELLIPIANPWAASRDRVVEEYFKAVCACLGLSHEANPLVAPSSYTAAAAYAPLFTALIDPGQVPAVARIP